MRDVIVVIIMVAVSVIRVDTISLAPVYWNHSNPM